MKYLMHFLMRKKNVSKISLKKYFLEKWNKIEKENVFDSLENKYSFLANYQKVC